MEIATNALGQPIGADVPGWSRRALPDRVAMAGTFVRLEPLDPGRHGADLFAAFAADATGRDWTYLPYGPFADRAAFDGWLILNAASTDPEFYTLVDPRHGRAVGLASYLRIDPAAGAIEVGHIHHAPAIQRGPATTEAMYLMMRRVFDDLGYRRYEWKCDALNAPSRAAARRLGFSFEGLFRQATVYKGRNRDTAWFSVLDREWPAIRAGFEAWLAPDNFSADGRQRTRLNDHLPAGRDVVPDV